MVKEVHYHCVYMYIHNGEVKTDTYQSEKHSYNTTDPNHIMRELRKEILKTTGRVATNFAAVGKTPIGTVYDYKLARS